MNFLWTTIIVNNLEESLKFYEEVVGLTLNKRYPAGPGVEIAFLGEGNTQVELICDSKFQLENKGIGVSLGFQVESLDQKMKMLKDKGFSMEGDIIQPNPHIKFFFIKDPNGVSVQFVEMM